MSIVVSSSDPDFEEIKWYLECLRIRRAVMERAACIQHDFALNYDMAPFTLYGTVVTFPTKNNTCILSVGPSYWRLEPESEVDTDAMRAGVVILMDLLTNLESTLNSRPPTQNQTTNGV
jgi:hypothetical protein